MEGVSQYYNGSMCDACSKLLKELMPVRKSDCKSLIFHEYQVPNVTKVTCGEVDHGETGGADE